MSERRGSPVVWGVRRAKAWLAKTKELAVVIDVLARKAEPYASPASTLDRNPEAIDSAFNTLRELHEGLAGANAKFHAQLEDVESLAQVRSAYDEGLLQQDELLAKEREARVEQQKANDAKDRLIAVVSHDLRGPLNAVLGWTEVLRQRDIDEETRQKALETIERAGRAQAALVEDLLDISRITTGKLKVHRVSIDLSLLVRRALDEVRPSAGAKKIELHLSGAEQPFYVLGDAARLAQVLGNLLGNALKFTPAGGAIFVTIGVSANEEGRVSVTVRDTGPGIKPETLGKIFESFQQNEGQAIDSHGGLGLGLYISKQLTALHYGTLVAESPGERRGSIFTLTLPLQTRSRTTEQAKPQVEDFNKPRLGGVRVLVVDDDPDARELSGMILRHSGAVVTLASSARAAFETFNVFAPDVVISDIRMEGADGNDFVRALRKSKHAGVPAIAVSAESGSANIRRSIELGFDAYLVKPIDMFTLVKAVEEAAEVGHLPST